MPWTKTRRAKARHELELDDCQWIATEDSILVPASRTVVITIGIRLQSQAHWSHNWQAAWGRTKDLRERMAEALSLISVEQVSEHLHGVARQMVLIRMAPRKLDTDNLAVALKPIRDQVCCWLAGDNRPDARANDGVRSGYTFTPRQQAQRAYGVRVELSV